MKKTTLFLVLAAIAFFAATGSAQSRRRATLISAENPSEGRCTVSIRLDGSANIEIRGDNAILRESNGSYPQWQRFECTGPLPERASLQLRAVEGTGRMVLTQDSNSSGVAVVRINNPDYRDQVYTFDVYWRWPNRVYSTSEADRVIEEDDTVRSCQNAVEDRIRGDGFRDVRFGGVSKDDRGANDRVIGTAFARRDGPADFSFTCRVDPLNGQVRRLDLTRR